MGVSHQRTLDVAGFESSIGSGSEFDEDAWS